MSLSEILTEVDQLTKEERATLATQLWARELMDDPVRTAEMSARLDRSLAGQNVVTEEELRARLVAAGRLKP